MIRCRVCGQGGLVFAGYFDGALHPVHLGPCKSFGMATGQHKGGDAEIIDEASKQQGLIFASKTGSLEWDEMIGIYAEQLGLEVDS